MKVRATKLGYYGDKRRKEGDTFFLKSEEAFSENWMEKVLKASESKKESKKVSGKKKSKKAPEVTAEAEASDSSQEVI